MNIKTIDLFVLSVTAIIFNPLYGSLTLISTAGFVIAVILAGYLSLLLMSILFGELLWLLMKALIINDTNKKASKIMFQSIVIMAMSLMAAIGLMIIFQEILLANFFLLIIIATATIQIAIVQQKSLDFCFFIFR